jgi:putative transposase
MDGKGRWMDNVFIERLWKSVKYEDIYLKAYGTMVEESGSGKTGQVHQWGNCSTMT